MNSKNPTKIIFSKFNKQENKNFFVRQEDFIIERGESDWLPTIKTLKIIQKTIFDGKSIPEYLSYQNISLWWFVIQSLEPTLKKTINFVIKFLKTIDEINPDILVIEDDFTYFNIIKQICQQRKIQLQYSSNKLFIYQSKQKLKKSIQRNRHKKITNNKLQKRKDLFTSIKNTTPSINNKILFAISTYYRRWVFNIEKNETERGEYIQQEIMNLLKNQNQILCIDLDYTFTGDSNILSERLKETREWIPLEMLLNLDSFDNKKHINFLNHYDDLINNKNFQNLFQIKNISLWSQIKDIFEMMTYRSYLPYYLLVIDSLVKNFKKNKPSVIFLPYETGPLALIFISVCRFYKIKTIGIQHAFIYENNPMYSHEKFATNENPQLFPIPDHTLVFGKATKKILVKSGYPPKKIIVFGHPGFFHMDQIKNSLSFKELDKKYCVSSNSKVILFTTGKLQRNYQDTGKYNHDEEIWRHLLKEFSNKKGFHLILKPHPLENDISIYEEILASFSSTNAKIIQGNLYELIYLSSLIVSVFSSTMLDALCFNKPVIRVKFGNEFISTIDSSKVIQSTELSTLSENILNVLSDDNIRKEIDANRSFFIKDQYGIPENEPAEILSKLLEHLSQ